LLISALFACSEGGLNGFSGGRALKKSSESKQVPETKNESGPETENVSGEAVPPKASDQFAVSGKSLDVYYVIDASNSLDGTDPRCLRFDAFKLFQEELKKLLGPAGDVRATLVLFSGSARVHSTRTDFLKLTSTELTSLYRSQICSTSSGTNVTDALDLTMSTAQRLQGTGKKDMSSVLFFTDGKPSDGNSPELASAVENIKAAFPSRIFSLLLTNDSKDFAEPLEFVTLVAGSKDRVRSTQDPTSLSTSILSFLK
jgi:uncharacterized protein YegL